MTAAANRDLEAVLVVDAVNIHRGHVADQPRASHDGSVDKYTPVTGFAVHAANVAGHQVGACDPSGGRLRSTRPYGVRLKCSRQ